MSKRALGSLSSAGPHRKQSKRLKMVPSRTAYSAHPAIVDLTGKDVEAGPERPLIPTVDASVANHAVANGDHGRPAIPQPGIQQQVPELVAVDRILQECRVCLLKLVAHQ